MRRTHLDFNRFPLEPGSIIKKNTPSLWISQLLIKLQSSSKKQKNPHGQLIWDRNTFQTSIYYSFPLKPGFIKNTPITVTLLASNWDTELIKKQKNPHGQLTWGGITFQSSIYNRFTLKPCCVKNIPLPEAQSSSKNQENLHTHLYWVE